MDEIRTAIAGTAKDVFNVSLTPELSWTDEQFGDYSTNVALQLAGKLNKPPREVAEALATKLRQDLSGQVSDVSVAGPGFINLRVDDGMFLDELRKVLDQRNAYGHNQSLANQQVIVEYSDPNPFKELHVGHLYDSVLGESIARLTEAAGASVHRVNFGGDVGLHVAKTLWAVLQALGGEQPDKLKDIPADKRASWLAAAYITGTNAYEDDPAAKQAIIEINARIYDVHTNNDHDSPLAQIYWTTRQWSYDYFNDFYARIGTKFEKYYPESVTAPAGLAAVKAQLAKGVFEESDGAVIFNGETHSLHTRVFINSKGLPTYETKDIGLALEKWKDYHFDLNIILTGNDIVEYMKVVLAALAQFEPELVKRTKHLTHGMVKLEGGSKMSSRKGNILRAVDVLDMTAEAAKKVSPKADDQVVQAAVKYAFLKQRYNADVIFNPSESVSLQGNSGPYLQYAHARAHSLLNKAGSQAPTIATDLQPGERSLARKLSQYAEVVNQAITDFQPHLVAGYLYELSQSFNQFYEKNRVVGDSREANRIQLVQAYAQILKNGLGLLNISAPESM